MSDKKLSEEEVADLKEAFAMFDINGDGKPSFRYDLTSFVASSRGSVPAGCHPLSEITATETCW